MPLRRITEAIHVYGGDFVAKPRSQWDAETLEEQPYDLSTVRREFENGRVGSKHTGLTQDIRDPTSSVTQNVHGGRCPHLLHNAGHERRNMRPQEK
jgi:hypothetical protein